MVDGTGLENQQVNSFAGSNPVPSARKSRKIARRAIFIDFLLRKKQDSSQVRYRKRSFRSCDPVPSAIN